MFLGTFGHKGAGEGAGRGEGVVDAALSCLCDFVGRGGGWRRGGRRCTKLSL